MWSQSSFSYIASNINYNTRIISEVTCLEQSQWESWLIKNILMINERKLACLRWNPYSVHGSTKLIMLGWWQPYELNIFTTYTNTSCPHNTISANYLLFMFVKWAVNTEFIINSYIPHHSSFSIILDWNWSLFGLSMTNRKLC